QVPRAWRARRKRRHRPARDSGSGRQERGARTDDHAVDARARTDASARRGKAERKRSAARSGSAQTDRGQARGAQAMSDDREIQIARDAALKRKLFSEKVSAMSVAEKQRLRELHFMRCPKCGLELEEIVLRGVRIDKCFGCGGLWLDAGELEELTQREHADLQ